jgi:hypothetical protein
MKRFSRQSLLLLASFLTLAGLVLMVWSVLRPTPIAVVAGLSAGQGLGVLGFLLYAAIVGRDLWKARILDVPAEEPPKAA